MKSVIDSVAEKIKNKENVLVMAVGDSITWGLNHCTAEETYVACLARLFFEHFSDTEILRYDGITDGEAIPISFYEGPFTVGEGKKGRITFVRSGVGGDTVRRALNRSDDFTGRFITEEMPDIFLLMFGINDSLISDGSKYVLPEVYYSNLCELYDLLQKENPNAQIVFMTPTYNDLGESEESCLEPYCEMMKKLAKEKACLLLDTHSLWMKHLCVGSENYGQRDWLSGITGDSCHFSPKGSLKTAEFIFRNLLGR